MAVFKKQGVFWIDDTSMAGANGSAPARINGWRKHIHGQTAKG
jgi:hypothetical protein